MKNTHSPWRTFYLCSVAIFLVSLDATIGFAAFPALRASFPKASVNSLSWVLIAYTVVYAAALVPAGRLADLIGRKRLFLIGLSLFSLASGICGLASDVETLVAFRIVQAVGAALLTPTSLALILQAFPIEKRPVAVSLWGAVGALAGAIGPSVGSLIIELSSWHWAFLINVPIGAIALHFSRPELIESHSTDTGSSLDLPGILLLVVGVGMLILGIVQSDIWGWNAPETIAAIASGIAVIIVLLKWVDNRPNAAFDLKLLNDPNYRLVNLATLAFGVAFTAMFFGFFLFLTAVWGYSLSKAGLAVTLGPMMVIPVAVLSGRFASKYGHRPLLVVGGIVYAISGIFFSYQLEQTPDYFRTWLPGLLISGVGVGLVLPALSGAAVVGLPPRSFGVGIALNVAVRQFGSALGVALSVAMIGKDISDVSAFKNLFLLLVAGGLLTSALSWFVDSKPASSQQRVKA